MSYYVLPRDDSEDVVGLTHRANHCNCAVGVHVQWDGLSWNEDDVEEWHDGKTDQRGVIVDRAMAHVFEVVTKVLKTRKNLVTQSQHNPVISLTFCKNLN